MFARLPTLLRQECQLARVDCLVSPLYRKRKLMNNTEAKELLGMCISECKRQAIDTAKQTVRVPVWTISAKLSRAHERRSCVSVLCGCSTGSLRWMVQQQCSSSG